MSLRIPIPPPQSPVRERETPASPTGSREFAVKRNGTLHDAGLHADMLGADDKRLWWIKPAGPLRIPR